MKISVVIKALNEEEEIALCLNSIIKELKETGLDYEVVLVDSISTDGTVDIAKQYPIRIVQFENQQDVCCGAAVELGYQNTNGDYILLIDGDMELIPGYISYALNELKNVDVAGVGGIIIDRDISSTVDKRRALQYEAVKSTHEVKSLGVGGLYKRAAIDSVGYFGHSSLKACEELELGLRLRKAGWSLLRTPKPMFYHTGHKQDTLKTLIRLAKNGRLGSYGVLLKIALLNDFFKESVKCAWFVILPMVIYLLLVSMLLFCHKSILMFFFETVFSWLLVAFLVSFRKRSVLESLESVVTWNFIFFTSVVESFKPIRFPRSTLAFLSIN